LKAEAQLYAEKAEWYGELAKVRRGRYIKAKQRKANEGVELGEANPGEGQPSKRVRLGD